MNVFGWIILVALLADYILNSVADALNLRKLDSRLPDEMADVYDEEAYRKSILYARDQTLFRRVQRTVSLIVVLAFWFAGGFAWLDQWVRSLGWNPILTGLLFISVLIVAQTILSIPFSAYSTFRIEERYGFNRTSPKTFVLDLIKTAVLGFVLGAPLLAAILWFFLAFGPIAWLLAWGAVTLFMLLVQYIAPNWIMPLFNKFVPLDDESPLKESILQYARKVKFPVSNVFVIDGSKRSNKSNAFFTGFGKNRRIALFDTLIESHTVPELTSILAHEIGHYKRRHIVIGTVIGIIQTGVLLFLLSIFLSESGLFEAFFVSQPSVYAGLVFFGMLYAPIDLVLSLAMNYLSRVHEFQADAFAVNTYEEPEAFSDALKKLSVHNLSNLNPHPFYVFLHYTHPPILARLAAIRSHR